MTTDKAIPAFAAAAGLAAAAYFLSRSQGDQFVGGGGGWSVAPPPPPRESSTKKKAQETAAEETTPSITINYPKESDIILTSPSTLFQPPTSTTGGGGGGSGGSTPTIIHTVPTAKKGRAGVMQALDVKAMSTSPHRVAAAPARETAPMRAPTPSGRITTVGPVGQQAGITIRSTPSRPAPKKSRSIFSRVRSLFGRWF